jgi:NADPH-dependent ferric siderophore reductase
VTTPDSSSVVDPQHESANASLVLPDSRPAYRPFRVRVARVEPLSPHFTRVTFEGADLGTFAANGLDQRINLVFPLEGGGITDCGWDDEQPLADGAWYARWRSLPTELRNPLRVYTVRAARPQLLELDVDFVVHGDGPAARWLARAASGDEIVVVGPDALSVNSSLGIDWHPGDASHLLVVGDETAVPAIAGILESLPEGRVAHAIVEVPHERDILPIDHAASVTVDWVPRSPAEPGSALLPAVTAWIAARADLVAGVHPAAPQAIDDLEPADGDQVLWDVPDAGRAGGGASLYTWVAGESGAVTAIRRHLVRDVGIDRGRIAFMGYWRRGRTTD